MSLAVKAFHLKYEGNKTDPNIQKWNVQILEVWCSLVHSPLLFCVPSLGVTDETTSGPCINPEILGDHRQVDTRTY